jgi:hypothetical protein
MRHVRPTTWTRLLPRTALLGALVVAGATTARAQHETRTNTRLDLPSAVEVPGQGTFALTGRLHVSFFVHRDNAGGVHVRAHANAQGVTVTKPGGAACRGVGAVNLTVNVGAPKGAATEGTAVANLGLICPGREPNLRLHANLHFTVNANNEVTATIANVRVTPQS